MLSIKNLHVSIEDKRVLQGINLEIKTGETHVIMGPNGSGKSTLASIIAGKKEYHITEGEIYFLNKNLVNFSPEERAHLGIFLSFQHPIEIPGISIINFIKTAINSIRKERNLNKMSAKEILFKIKNTSSRLNIENDFIYRSLNEGFSGGEKKRNEIFQMMMLNPLLSILDEVDSGLDIDALRVVSQGINAFRNKKNSILIITHYKRLLDHILSDYIVHILYNGKIIQSGDKKLSEKLEKEGYDWIAKTKML
ncbi:putative FeS assembly ATPase SufC [Blattabacterium sp. (Blattella germanica) str. Bge]|uniref:Fe-S cluster assembly ATPase SufC n=1 Tax=Blattabacterium sp. (Blattella germanica) TaxID=624186 RepID=UPI0001BB62BC|nr:Fe-S cluster assembly ATPase SufC [Blattabacterium sp. (Blattella germanica)]ACY40060.1 putative FeS assembly ATPase SufC [Blattabacterium sp. (Blattella germanica) str. Bge]